MTNRRITRIPVSEQSFRAIRWLCQQRKIYFIAGINSIFVPSRQEKYMVSHKKDGAEVCRIWPDWNGEELLMTPGEAARTELEREFGTVKRVGWQPKHIKLLDARPPMLFTGPVESDDGLYVDLKGAYHQIYSRLWLDTYFPCGYGSLYMMPVALALGAWKSARNSVLGIARSREATGVFGFKQIRLSVRNPFLSPHLWATVQEILNELAFYAERMGAEYVATDGYLFSEARRGEEFISFLESHDLTYRTLRGSLEVRTWGGYKIGEKQTKLYDRVWNLQSKPFRSINIQDSDYPCKVLRWWSRAVPHYLSVWGGRVSNDSQ